MNVDDLTKAQQQQLADAREWVKVQQQALDEVGPAIMALAQHEDRSKLSRNHVGLISKHLRWGDEDYDLFLDMDIEQRRVQLDKFFRTPIAYFYVNRDGKNYQVVVRHGEGTRIIPEDHPEYDTA